MIGTVTLKAFVVVVLSAGFELTVELVARTSIVERQTRKRCHAVAGCYGKRAAQGAASRVARQSHTHVAVKCLVGNVRAGILDRDGEAKGAAGVDAGGWLSRYDELGIQGGKVDCTAGVSEPDVAQSRRDSNGNRVERRDLGGVGRSESLGCWRELDNRGGHVVGEPDVSVRSGDKSVRKARCIR